MRRDRRYILNQLRPNILTECYPGATGRGHPGRRRTLAPRLPEVGNDRARSDARQWPCDVRPRFPADAFLTAARPREIHSATHRVTATESVQQPVDVQTIHETEFRRARAALAERAPRPERSGRCGGLGRVRVGQEQAVAPGVFGEWAADGRVSGGRAVLVNFLELRGGPGSAAPVRAGRPLSVFSPTASACHRGTGRHSIYCWKGLIRPVVAGGKKSLTPAELDAAFRTQMTGPAGRRGGCQCGRPGDRRVVTPLPEGGSGRRNRAPGRRRRGSGGRAATRVVTGWTRTKRRPWSARPADVANPARRG